jgi:hypothetical protein
MIETISSSYFRNFHPFFLEDVNFFVAAVFGIPYFLPFIHYTDDMSFHGNKHDRSRQANNQHCSLPGALHSLALGVPRGAMLPA